MKNKLSLFVSFIALFVSFFLFFTRGNKNSVGYLYFDDLMLQYNAVQDVNSKMKVTESQEKAKLDGYYMVIQEKIKNLEANKSKLKKSEIRKLNKEIIALERKHQQLNLISQNRLDSIRKELLVSVYNNVNQAIKIFAEENNYDYILGNLGNGNIMYGKEINNVTLEVIDYINVKYNSNN